MTVLSKFSLQDKVAVVTGAGRGIGKGIALGFAEAGAHVVIAEIDPSTVKAAADDVRALGRRSLSIQTDVRDSRQVATMVEATMAEFGRIDVLVNNAGIGVPLAPVVETSEESWDRIFSINMRSIFLCCKTVARIMIDQEKGSIINISSIGGLRAVPGMASNGAAKAAVISFTQSLAAELAPYHVRVNCIAPGQVLTNLRKGVRGANIGGSKMASSIPLGRMGQPEDVAMACIYLASDASDYVTGDLIQVKGGPILRIGDMEQFVEKFPSLKSAARAARESGEAQP